MATFTHPSGNGYTESIDLLPCTLWVALFGPFYMAYKRAWVGALILLILNPLGAFLGIVIGSATAPLLGIAAWVAYMFLVGWGCVGAVEEAYLKRGWKQEQE